MAERQDIANFFASNLKMVYHASNLFSRHIGYRPEELIGTCAVAVDKCLDKYDRERGYELSTYYYICCRNSIYNFIAADSESRRRHRLLDSGRQESLGDALKAYAYHERSYFWMYRIPEPDEEWIADLFELFDGDPAALFRAITRSLSPRQQMIIEMRFKQDMTLEAIGHELGITRERIRQIVNRSLDLIRQHMMKLDDVAKVFGLHGVPTREQLTVNSTGDGDD